MTQRPRTPYVYPEEPGRYVYPPSCIMAQPVPTKCPCCSRAKFRDWREWERHTSDHHPPRSKPDVAVEWRLFQLNFQPWTPYARYTCQPTPDGKWRPTWHQDEENPETWPVRFNSLEDCQRAVMQQYWGQGGPLYHLEQALDRIAEDWCAQRREGLARAA